MAGTDTTSITKVAKSRRGAKPGERRGGRVAGTPNKCTKTLKELSREYTTEALQALVEVVRTETGSARVAAANAILDRGYGKPSTVIAGDEEGNPAKLIHEIILRGVGT